MRELICVGNRAKGVAVWSASGATNTVNFFGVFGAAPPVANVVAVEPFVLGDN